MIHLDYRRLVTRADLHYLSPVEWPAEGIPLGNGRMGTMVWTTPGSVRFQLNRCDVFATDRNHAGHEWGPNDYAGACGQVAIEFEGEPFSRLFRQHLSVYDAECTAEGHQVHVRCFVSSARDVLVLQVDDRRRQPRPLRVNVSMWLPPQVKTTLMMWPDRDVEKGTHTAGYEFDEVDDRLLLVRNFSEVRKYREERYECTAGIAAQVLSGSCHVEAPDERARTIVCPAGGGRTTIMISTAGTRSTTANAGALALEVLTGASARSYEFLREEHLRWWHDYWSGSFVHTTSDDGVADFMERMRTLHMYYTASTSRGEFPPGIGAMLFATSGDLRHFGAQFWVWVTEMQYYPLFAGDAIELTDPYLSMYVKQLPACRTAAQQRWGVKGGAFFPETLPFNGPVVLPDDAAREFREFFEGRRALAELSVKTRALCQYESQLFQMLRAPANSAAATTRPYGPIGHITTSGSKIAHLAWWRYRYTGDRQWLREDAYPLLRETVEFYRHLVRKQEDGLYHIHGTNVHEMHCLANDSISDIAAIRGTAPLAIRAAEILGVDAELRSKWQDLLDHLAPYAMGNEPESKALARGCLAEDVWSAGHVGEVADHFLEGHPGAPPDHFGSEDVWTWPVFPFEDWTLETRDGTTDAIVQKVIDLCPNHARVLAGGVIVPSLIRTPICCARAGRGDDLAAVLASHLTAYQPLLSNGLSLFEGGIQSTGAEHSGLVALTMQEGLLQSVSPRPGEPEIVSVFPAWPRKWQASFCLLARGGFLVTSAVCDGEIQFVEIESRLGEECRLRNPWSEPCMIRETEGATRELDGDILRFATARGGRYVIAPKGTVPPGPRRVSPEPATGPVSFSFTLPSGVTVSAALGRNENMPFMGLEEREEEKVAHAKGRWW